ARDGVPIRRAERPALERGVRASTDTALMRIADAFGPGRAPVVSFEFFPPRTPEAETRLFDTVTRLAPLRPTFVSVTYGAGGPTRRLTRDVVTRVKPEVGGGVRARPS